MEPKRRKSGGRRRVCLAKNCGMNSHSANYDENTITMFPFPTDTERCNAWLKLIGRTEYIGNPVHKRSKNSVCSLHFEESDLVRQVLVKLKPDAFPFLNLASEMPTTQSSSVFSSPATFDADAEVTTTELRCATDFLETLGMTQTASYNQAPDTLMINDDQIEKIAASDLITHVADDNLSPLDKLRIFIKRSTSLLSHLRDQVKLRDVALNLLFSNPETYRFLKPSCVMQLPNIKSLSSACIATPFGAKIDDRLFQLLWIRLKYMPVAARYCTICITEFKVTPRVYYDITHDIVTGLADVDGHKSPQPAEVAVIATLRGIRLPWLQPISFCFLSAQNKNIDYDAWLTKIILKLQQIEIIVQAVTVPPTEEFYKFALEKQISCSNPFFMENVNFVFDAPQLIRRVRDIFIKKDINVGTEVAKFEYVRKSYNLGKVRDVSLTPNLGSIHLNPSRNMLSTRVAAQTLSRSVAAAIHYYVDAQLLPAEARVTGRFIKTINDAFDVVNKTERYKKVSVLKETINSSIATLTTQLSCDDGGNFNENLGKTGEMFAITVASVSNIIIFIQGDGCSGFNPRELNLEPLDGMLKKLKAYNNESTCQQFVRSFRSLCKYYMFVAKRPQLPKRENLKQFVERMYSLPALRPDALREKSLLLLQETIDYHFDLPEQDELVYLAAYLLYKCYIKHRCSGLSEMFERLQPITGVKHFQHVNHNLPLMSEMRVPKATFNSYVRQLNNRFVVKFPYCLDGRVGGALVTELNKISWIKYCDCFPTQYLINLFVRVRLYIAMKRFNKMIKNNTLDNIHRI